MITVNLKVSDTYETPVFTVEPYDEDTIKNFETILLPKANSISEIYGSYITTNVYDSDNPEKLIGEKFKFTFNKLPPNNNCSFSLFTPEIEDGKNDCICIIFNFITDEN